MKRFVFLFALLFALALPGAAQSLCTITGTLYDSTGAACNGCRLTVSRARSGSTPLSQGSQPIPANSSGVISFTAVQGSFITITGPFTIGRYNLAGGLEFYVPLQSSATLATLQTAEDALNALISSTTYAPADIPVITKTASGSLSNEFALGSLATGLLKNTTTTGVPTIAVAGTDYVAPGAITGGGQTMTTARILGRSTASTGAIEEISIGSGLSLSGGTLSASGGGAVSSVFGRTGAVVAAQDDYTFAQLASKPTTLSGYGITDAQGLDADLTAIGGLSPTNDDIIQRKAGAWTNRTVAQFKTDLGLATIATSGSASDLSAGTVPLARLAGITNTEIDNAAAIAYSKLNLTGAIVNGDLAGSIAATKLSAGNVDNTEFDYLNGLTGAIQTQIDGKAATTITLTAGAGLTGGGDLSANRSFAVGAGTGIAVNADDVALDINGLTAETTIASGDYVPIYDVSASAIRKMTRSDFLSGISGGSPGGSPTQIQYNNAGAFGGISGATSDGTNVTFGSGNLLATSPVFTTNQTTTNNSIGTTSTDGIILQNTTAAAAGAQQYSPRLRLTGQGWKTNATAASQTVDWAIENQPVQGAANPTSNLVFLTQVNGGGYTGRYTFASSANTITFSAGDVNINANAASSLNWGAGGTNPAVSTNGSNVGIKSSGHWGWGSSTVGTPNGDTGLTRLAAAVVRVSNMSTGAGSFCVGCTSTVGSIGTSGVGVLAIANGTAPTSSPADEFQLYSADSAAGDANAFARNEAGEINRLTGLSARNSSSFAKTSDTTLANITGLTRNVEASRAYAFTAVLQSTAAATGGVKFAVSGTATATSISYEGVLVDSGVVVNQTRATALDTAVCASTTSTAGTCTIRGVIVVNAAGTLTLQFAQNASDGGASTVLVNQYMQLIPIS